MLRIRRLDESDPPVIAASFARIGSVRPAGQYVARLAEQAAGHCESLVAEAAGAFAGYVILNWRPSYPPLAEARLPEIQDLNVLPAFRRRGIATRLLDEAEALAAARAHAAGIAVGLHAGYNAAQRLYGLRGYVPDGRGVTWRGRPVGEYQPVTLDDDLVLHLLKPLAPPPGAAPVIRV